MLNSKLTKIILAMAVLVVLIGIAFRFVGNGPQQSSNPQTVLNEIAERRQLATRHPAHEGSSDQEAQEQPATNASIWPPPLPREKIEEYLRRHNRDAASLLAAFHATRGADSPLGDIKYLKEATTNFPGDAQVQQAVLAQDVFPEDRRKWLDALKASSPDNSLANYLSAHDDFKNGKPEAAINELLEASGKTQFNNYTTEARLNEEELRLGAGESPLEAKLHASGWAQDLLPTLATFKQLALDMQDLQKKYLTSGDTSSAQNLADMGVALASRLKSGDIGKIAINQLVGIAIERIAMQNLDQNVSYDFLGGKTPQERIEELKQQKAKYKDLARNLNELIPAMTDAERLSFMDRERVYGELEAMQWLQQRYATNAP